MKKIILFFIPTAVFLASCGSKKLGREDVSRMLRDEKAYPKVVEYRVFCGNNETAVEMHERGLDQQGFVTVQLEHTMDDVGKPLINFTEKSKPYLVETSGTHRSIDAQNVKIGDEYFRDVTEITTNAKGDRAEVAFTTSLKNKTPFMVLSHENKDSIQSRMTYFSLTNDGWKWEGKIIKTQRKGDD